MIEVEKSSEDRYTVTVAGSTTTRHEVTVSSEYHRKLTGGEVSPEAWRRDPEKVLAFYNTRRRQLYAVEPNAGHLALPFPGGRRSRAAAWTGVPATRCAQTGTGHRRRPARCGHGGAWPSRGTTDTIRVSSFDPPR